MRKQTMPSFTRRVEISKPEKMRYSELQEGIAAGTSSVCITIEAEVYLHF